MDSIEQLELKRLMLQNDIELLEKRMNLTDSEERTTLVSDKSEMKKNSLEVKQLRKQVEEMRVRLQKHELGDAKLVQEVLHLKYRGANEIKGPSAKEMIKQVESRVLDLNNKSVSLSHSLQIMERSRTDSEQLLKEMSDQCRDDNTPTEADCIQNIRDLENEHLKALKNIAECENAKLRLKAMLQILRKRGKSYHRLLMDLKEEKMKLEENGEGYISEEQIESECRNVEDEESEIKNLKYEISLIKDTTACHRVNDIDSRFLEQRAVHDDLTEMVKQAEKRLQELREEKRNLTSKRALMKEADAIYPKSDIELSVAKHQLKEQEIRLDTANTELQRLNSVSNRAKEVFQRLISKIKPKANKGNLQNSSVGDLSKKLEEIVIQTFPSTDSTPIS